MILKRHRPPDRLLLFGQIDAAAAAFADFLQQLVTADARSDALVLRQLDPAVPCQGRPAVARLEGFGGNLEGRAALREKPLRLGLAGEHLLHGGAQRGIAHARLIQEDLALVGILHLERGVIDQVFPLRRCFHGSKIIY